MSPSSSPNPGLDSASPVAALAGAILEVVSGAIASGDLMGDVARSLTADRVPLERPKNREHGDYATSIALTLAKSEGKAPREIAVVIKSGLEKVSGVARVEIAGPGFINITLDKSSQGAIVNRILSERENFGKVKLLSGVKINLEFISANPTGPLHLGHTRWAAVGDALASVLAAAGAEVVREFYVNDRGNQMDLFGASIRAAALGIPRPEDGYQGDYINDLAKLILTQHPDFISLPEAEGIVAFREAGYALQLQEQKDVLDNFGTHFDLWFSERSLHSGDSLSNSLAKLRSQGHVYELDGATWLRTTDFGDDKDRVLIKSGGELTYFASDTAYYIDK